MSRQRSGQASPQHRTRAGGRLLSTGIIYWGGLLLSLHRLSCSTPTTPHHAMLLTVLLLSALLSALCCPRGTHGSCHGDNNPEKDANRLYHARGAEIRTDPPSVPAELEEIAGPGRLVCFKPEQEGEEFLSFVMGASRTDTDLIPGDGETPQRRVQLSPFCVEETEVTNAQFARFVAATGYVTDSERYGWSFVFESWVPELTLGTIDQAVQGSPWWVPVNGASWFQPEGPETNLTYLPDGHHLCSERAAVQLENHADAGCVLDRWLHPAVHLSWNDANAYCQWVSDESRRLLTEAEFEYALRDGLDRRPFPWGEGDQSDEHGDEFRANIWQGNFPKENTAADGFVATAPARSFPPTRYGLFDITGNAWEYVSDWWSTTRGRSRRIVDPTGPRSGEEKVQRGGSLMCHRDTCFRYKSYSRTKNPPDSAAGNTGFRCAATSTTRRKSG
jgi:formylglycine-generating enzyme